MKANRIIVLLFILTISGCGGDRIIKNDNCIPSVEYVSTDHGVFISYQLVNHSDWRSFDALQVYKDDQWLLEIVRKGERNIKDIAGSSVTIEEHPNGTKLVLSGEAKTRSPWGLMAEFYSDMTYLKGNINGKTVWIPAFELSRLNKDGNTTNIESNKLIGLDKFVHNWECLKK